MNQNASVDYGAVTARQQEAWATGDFHEIARQNVVMAEALCAAVDPRGGDRVLDVACGSGTAALVAARRYCEVTGIDYVPALIERAKRRAAAEGFGIDFRVADAQTLPFPDASFDAVLSVYGVQFAPDQERAASEMLRVCRPGGKIGLATPLPQGWSGDFFATNAKYMPPPPGLRPPMHWGTEAGLKELLGSGTSAVDSEERTALQYYRSVDHAVEVFLNYFGPAMRAASASDDETRESLRSDLRAVFDRYNRATDGSAVVENRYLLTVGTRTVATAG
ncbi:class I SAM-dependent methyltransferase [Aidingimonas halophila]|uniref:Methyltransferase domain-containing protein n=1 Tax=Aidingimonas halophila TaxID=574349 RepID=A0A1H3GSP8_9GAMM|nr:class I SAM-dependent methyltransferase [Aidingimonas halophila]GHC35912.1 methyltransferase [Aidingimonas halophila]SDY06372.1 Methyltransferase domain-containing protein [Aidingimonas halophila]